jgi:hypothetical protein
MKKILLLAFLVIGSTMNVVAQDNAKPVDVEIVKKDGEKLKGKIIQIRRDSADFQVAAFSALP